MFTQNTQSICEGSCINFTNNSQNGSGYQWYFPGGIPSSNSSFNPPPICYNNSGTYDVTLITTNANGTDSLTVNNSVIIFPAVQFSGLTQNGDTIFTLPGLVSYQWYYDSTLIQAANNYYLVATMNGNYSVIVTDSNGCSAAATLYNVQTNINDPDLKNNFYIYYSNSTLFFEIDKAVTSEDQLTIFNETGQLLYTYSLQKSLKSDRFQINGIQLSAGIYFVRFESKNGQMTKKIVVE
jgi:hypothetical protein